ncbi:MAG: VCBS repeat-containing protein [Mucilaginibacter sp.]
MRRNRFYTLPSFIYLLIIVVAVSVLLTGCKNQAGTGNRYALTGDTVIDGKDLVQINCTKCHALVPANALTKDVWKFHTLPAMGKYLGMTSYLGGYFKRDTSGLTLLEWQNIVSYYQKMAPESLPKRKPPVNAVNSMAGFTLVQPKAQPNVAYTAMAAINPYNHKIYTSDGVSNILQEWDSSLKLAKSVILPSPAVNASFVKGEKGEMSAEFSAIGQLDPVDFPNGKILSVNLDGRKLNPTVFASELARPVQTLSGDFNKDGLVDWVVCGQGGLKGGVYLFKQNADHSVTQVNISEKAGAVKAVIGDFNKDGWPDLMVLFGRGDEGLVLFLNDQHGAFTQKRLLSFPPVYGSTDFELADIDHDGNLDLIYTCGYNFNDSRILKPYHGLYLYKNTGDFNFKEQWFYPINGCTRFVTADFNGDGKLDIVTTAFFADLKNNPAEGCIYFEQEGPFSYKPYTIPVSQYGRWWSIDVGDINNDGKPDIVLGNFSTGYNFQPGFKSTWDKKTPFIVLRNNFKK